jgi:hypothetical protein
MIIDPVNDSTYDVFFELLMPGQAKRSAYKINVRASCYEEALHKAEEEWAKNVKMYSVRLENTGKVSKENVA